MPGYFNCAGGSVVFTLVGLTSRLRVGKVEVYLLTNIDEHCERCVFAQGSQLGRAVLVVKKFDLRSRVHSKYDKTKEIRSYQQPRHVSE